MDSFLAEKIKRQIEKMSQVKKIFKYKLYVTNPRNSTMVCQKVTIKYFHAMFRMSYPQPRICFTNHTSQVHIISTTQKISKPYFDLALV